MSLLNRRKFLEQSKNAGLVAAVGGSILGVPSPVRAKSPSDKITLGMIGIRGRGSLHSTGFAKRDDCRVAYLADVDTRLFGSAATAGYMRFTPPEIGRLPRAKAVEKLQGKPPKTVQDFRRVLDDKSVDAICVSTPDHWHAPLSIMACQAGKHVYVEKPIAHNPWEGRKLVEAARKYDRVVQAGTQCRSAPYIHEAKKYIDDGKLGDIHMVRVFNQKSWANAAKVADSRPPKEFDWDMWQGPAPEYPFNTNYAYKWHHYWRYSGGDALVDPVHQIDLARWMIGRDYPKSVYSTGGRFGPQGDFETPDTQVSVWDYGDLLMTFEMTLCTPYMILVDQKLRDGDIFPHWPQNSSRVEIYGTKGLMYLGRHGIGWQVYGRPKSRKPVVVAQEYGRWTDDEHKDDFIDAIRNHRRPNADVEIAHLSNLLPLYGTISYRLGGQKLLVDPKTETFTNSPEGNRMLKREYRKPWIVPEVV